MPAHARRVYTGRAHRARRLAAAWAAVLLGSVIAAGTPTAATAAATEASFGAVADTYVDVDRPTTSYGLAAAMTVDGSPVRQAFLKFDLSTLAGRAVTGARLRLHQVDSSAVGGMIHRVASDSWNESTTWNSRPAVDGSLLGSFGRVAAGNWYEAELDPAGLPAGVLSLAMTSTSADGARWASRQSSTPPSLIVTVASAEVIDGLSQVAAADAGSSEPTYYAANHRLAVTANGRLLAVHGKHASGVQLAWRDPAATWQTRTTGSVLAGDLLAGTGTGDWTASIGVFADEQGAEQAWVVWSGPTAEGLRPVQMRRVTELDAPAGPRVGPVVTVDAPPLGAYKADVSFETGTDGRVRACVLYSRRVGDTTYQLTAVWSSAPATDAPVFGDRAILETSPSNARYGSLVPSPAGLRAVARAGSSGGGVQLFSHAVSSPLSTWTSASSGLAIAVGASPTAVALSTGEIVVAVEKDLAQHVTAVHRFFGTGISGATELQVTGLAQPSVVSDGARVWLVAIRVSDGALVSRTWSSGGGWTADDRVEVAAATAGRLAWPNVLRQPDGRLRVLVEGPGTSSTRSSVWAFQRLL